MVSAGVRRYPAFATPALLVARRSCDRSGYSGRGRVNHESVGELLAILTAGGCLGQMVPGAPSRSSLRPSDVAAALAQVEPDTTVDLLLVLYCHHAPRDLGVRLTPELRQNRQLNLSASFDEKRLGALIDLALVDLSAPVVCVSCQGRGMVRQNAVCGTCGGTGNLPKQRAAALAAMFGVAKSTWSEHWAWRYQIVFRQLNQMVSDGLYQLKTALGA